MISPLEGIRSWSAGEHRFAAWPHTLAGPISFAAPALVAYGIVRLVGMAVLWLWSHHAGVAFWPLLNQRYDSVWYVGIAARGYDTHISISPDGQPVLSNLAFFPLYPALIRAVAVLPISLPNAALLISWLAAFGAAWGLFQIGSHLHGHRCGIALATLWGTVPHALVESMAYTETLFTALAAWALYAVLIRRWLTAGTLCCLAGLTRPTGLGLAAAVAVGAGIAIWRSNDGWRPWLAAGLGASGSIAFIAWVGFRLGRVDGWFYVQGTVWRAGFERTIWQTGFDGGRYTLQVVRRTLFGRGVDLDLYVVLLVVIIAGLLFMIGAWSRQPLPLLVYAAAILVLTLGSASDTNKARLLLPAFTLLLPAATNLAQVRTRDASAVIGLLAAISAWFGGYLALIWRWSP